MHKLKKTYKVGAKKIRNKRIAEFRAAGSDPKQKKLHFGPSIITNSSFCSVSIL